MIRLTEKKRNERAKTHRNDESASDADGYVFRLELAIFHESIKAQRPTQVYANLKGTQNEKVLPFRLRHP
jgi:hypothetical protein